MTRTITRNEASRFYDKFGAKQDRQGFYEDAALDLMIELGKFPDAENVFELGCGTGRLAEQLLSTICHAQLIMLVWILVQQWCASPKIDSQGLRDELGFT